MLLLRLWIPRYPPPPIEEPRRGGGKKIPVRWVRNLRVHNPKKQKKEDPGIIERDEGGPLFPLTLTPKAAVKASPVSLKPIEQAIFNLEHLIGLEKQALDQEAALMIILQRREDDMLLMLLLDGL